MSRLRGSHGGDWQRGPPDPENHPGPGKHPGGLVLHLRLPKVSERGNGDTGGKGGESAQRHLRQLRLAGSRGAYHGPEVLHGQPPVPTGAGVGAAGREADPADHEQLDFAVRRGWLEPVYDELHRQLVRRSVLHADETALQVLHEPGKSAQTKSCMWLYRTGGDAEHSIVLCVYQSSRKGAHAEAFLKDFAGYLHADGCRGCYKLPGNIRVVGCWAHARRKFDEALNAIPPDKREGSDALIGLQYCNELFAWEKRFEALDPEERYIQRLELGSCLNTAQNPGTNRAY